MDVLGDCTDSRYIEVGGLGMGIELRTIKAKTGIFEQRFCGM
jgi:hypothetical protein